jgi:uncharacterized protein
MPSTGSIADLPIEEILRLRFGIERAQLVAICQRFHIIEMGLFGSALRDDFRPDGDDPSDVDLLVVFEPGYQRSWQDYIALQDTLRDLFQREVDVVLKKLLDNPYRRARILRSNRVIYESSLK